MSETTPTTLNDLTGTWTIDDTHTRIGFVARHAMVTKVRGAFNEFTGTATIDGSNFSNSNTSVTISVSSIDTRNSQRDEHLVGEDFFATAEHPEITFKSTAVNATGSTTFDLTGDLTIKGVTQSVTIPFDFDGVATDPFGNLRAGFEGSTSINRRDFNLEWNAPLDTGGVLVGEKITLEFEVSAIKNA